MSVTSRLVEAKAARGGRLTLSDVKAFVAMLDEAGAAGTTPVDARTTMGGHLRELSARAVRFGDAPPSG